MPAKESNAEETGFKFGNAVQIITCLAVQTNSGLEVSVNLIINATFNYKNALSAWCMSLTWFWKCVLMYDERLR